jgi:hypothetical protein
VKRKVHLEVSVFILLAMAGIALRMCFQVLPNFAPVAALALFAGYYFRSRWTAAALPLCVMMVTDLMIGGYEPAVMAAVYLALAAPVLWGGFLRRLSLDRGEQPHGAWTGATAATAGLATSSLAASVFFFLASNFAHWVFTDMYPKTAEGLGHCYTAALPFFRYTLAGDLAFASVLFGGYALATMLMVKPAAAMEKAAL